jgi:hypothetical protein
VATQEWVPLHAPASRRDHGSPLDAVDRFGRLARAYGVGAADAAELVDVVFEERAQALRNIRREVEAGNPVWTEQWDDDEQARAALDDAWLATQRDTLVAAITERTERGAI